MKEKRKTEGDRIAFEIHFATGCVGFRHMRRRAMRAMDHLLRLAIWNPNCVNGSHRDDTPMLLPAVRQPIRERLYDAETESSQEMMFR